MVDRHLYSRAGRIANGIEMIFLTNNVTFITNCKGFLPRHSFEGSFGSKQNINDSLERVTENKQTAVAGLEFQEVVVEEQVEPHSHPLNNKSPAQQGRSPTAVLSARILTAC